MYARVYEDQEGVLDPLEVELQAVISHLMWVPGTKY